VLAKGRVMVSWPRVADRLYGAGPFARSRAARGRAERSAKKRIVSPLAVAQVPAALQDGLSCLICHVGAT
jgi:hypothetical protein